MALSENIAERLTLKAYADASIATTEPAPASDPGASGGQQLRHVSHSLSLAKDYYAPNEKRADRTQAMGRHGMKRGPGGITGLLSPLTYEECFEAALQGTWAAAVTGSQSDFTSVTADNTTSKFTFAGGDPVAKGFRIGDIVRFSSLLDADNNGKNFLIVGFGGASNREVTVYPAPDTMTADSGFTLTTVGKSLSQPTSSHVKRKVAAEVYNPDTGLARLYKEGRFGGFTLTVPPNDNAQVSFDLLFRNRQKYSAGSAPFFTAPTAPTTTGILSGIDGVIYLNGSAVGVVTGITLRCAKALAIPNVIGSEGLGPDILLGPAEVGGDLSALLTDATLSDLFDNETETSVLLYMTATSAVDTPAMSFYLPRIKLNSDQESDGAELAKVVAHSFSAATYEGSAAGVVGSVMRICDTEVV